MCFPSLEKWSSKFPVFPLAVVTLSVSVINIHAF